MRYFCDFSLVSLGIRPRSRRCAERTQQGEGRWSRPLKPALERSYLTENSSSANCILRPRRKKLLTESLKQKNDFMYVIMFITIASRTPTQFNFLLEISPYMFHLVRLLLSSRFTKPATSQTSSLITHDTPARREGLLHSSTPTSKSPSSFCATLVDPTACSGVGGIARRKTMDAFYGRSTSTFEPKRSFRVTNSSTPESAQNYYTVRWRSFVLSLEVLMTCGTIEVALFVWINWFLNPGAPFLAQNPRKYCCRLFFA